MRKKVILQVISHIDMGGAERVAINLAMSNNPNLDYHVVEVERGHSAFSDALKDEMVRGG